MYSRERGKYRGTRAANEEILARFGPLMVKTDEFLAETKIKAGAIIGGILERKTDKPCN